jgi:hypothetical protein
MSFNTIRFTIRKRGGALGGQSIQQAVAEFDWTTFKNTANAEAFVKKSYYAAAQRLARELAEGKNQTEAHHLQTMESLIARSLKFTKEEIQEWCESRDWDLAKFTTEREKGIRILKENLPSLSASEFAFPERLRKRAAEIVAEVADSNADPIADYLFVKLSQEQQKSSILDLL